MTDEHSILIARYLDGSATRAEVEQVDVLLRTGPGIARDLLDLAGEELSLRTALRPNQENERPLVIKRATGTSLAKSLLRPRLLAAAAVLLAVAGIAIYMANRTAEKSNIALVPDTAPAPVATISLAGPGAWIERGGLRQPAGVAAAISPRDVLRTGAESGITFTYASEQTVVNVGPSSAITIQASAGGKRIELSQGFVDCEVAKQQPGRPLIVATPSAEVRVVGTRYRVQLATGWTRVEVTEGTVRVSRKRDQAAVDVSAGEFVDVAPGVAPGGATSSTPYSAAGRGRNMAEFWSAKIKPAGIDQ